MGSKCRLIMIIGILLLIALFFILFNGSLRPKNVDYVEELFSVFEEQETTTVDSVFPFDFECAYIFNDCYISGEGLAERYNLNISISQVEKGTSENIQRIVFVDKNGSFVYEFKCDSNKIVILGKGMIIYPETIIKKKSSASNTPLTLQFESLEYYDS